MTGSTRSCMKADFFNNIVRLPISLGKETKDLVLVGYRRIGNRLMCVFVDNKNKTLAVFMGLTLDEASPLKYGPPAVYVHAAFIKQALNRPQEEVPVVLNGHVELRGWNEIGNRAWPLGTRIEVIKYFVINHIGVGNIKKDNTVLRGIYEEN